MLTKANPLPVQVDDGRWGPRHVRTSECHHVVTAEGLYGSLRRDPRARAGAVATMRVSVPQSAGPARVWAVAVELVANRIWRAGRAFLRCPGCDQRVARLYVPVEDLQPRCRRCWALTYESRALYRSRRAQ